MNTHTTTAPDHDHTGPAAEPDRTAFRLDQRGIALQTVIITVVMLAIAGIVAAVLFSRAQDASDQLEGTSIAAIEPANFDSRLPCQGAGHGWDPIGSGCKERPTTGPVTNCAILNPRWEPDGTNGCKVKTS